MSTRGRVYMEDKLCFHSRSMARINQIFCLQSCEFRRHSVMLLFMREKTIIPRCTRLLVNHSWSDSSWALFSVLIIIRHKIRDVRLGPVYCKWGEMTQAWMENTSSVWATGALSEHTSKITSLWTWIFIYSTFSILILLLRFSLTGIEEAVKMFCSFIF